ncbi:MAG TPA: flagellar motor switch phosphatase FliY [Bacilli bacterium]
MTNNNDYLSQEEIDALLKQNLEDVSTDTGMDMYSDRPVSTNVNDYLTNLEQDALGEIANITFGSASTALSTLLGKKVEITTPKLDIISRDELSVAFPLPHVAIHVEYVEGFEGINLLVVKTSDAQVIADLMLGGDGQTPAEELTEIHISAVQEAMNQMMGASATSMSTLYNRFINISPPGIDILNIAKGEGTANFPNDDVMIQISFRLIIGTLIDSTIMQLLPQSFAKEMVSSLMGGSDAQEPATSEFSQIRGNDSFSSNLSFSSNDQNENFYSEPAANMPMFQQPSQQTQQPMYEQPMFQQPPMQQQPMYQQPMFEQPPMSQQPMFQGQPPAGLGNMQNRNVNVQPVQYTNFAPGYAQPSDNTNLNLLLDIPLKVTVELGRTQKLIKDILELSQGSIIELDKLAGEPVDILVNNKLVAKGEVVVIDENFGVRVTDIVSQWDRIQKLQ